MDEPVPVRGADRLFIEVFGIQHASFDACDLRADQRGAVFKVLRTTLGPYLELPLVDSESLEMLRSGLGRRRVEERRPAETAVEVILSHFQIRRRRPEKSSSPQRS